MLIHTYSTHVHTHMLKGKHTDVCDCNHTLLNMSHSIKQVLFGSLIKNMQNFI